MKKTYIAPSATSINLLVEGMMAASAKLDYSSNETVTNEDNVLSNDRAWSSDNWSTDED